MSSPSRPPMPSRARGLGLACIFFLGLPAGATGQAVVGVAWDGERGGPVAGALIVVRSESGADVGHRGAVSDASGRFRLDLSSTPKPVAILAQKAGFGTSTPYFVPAATAGGGEPLEALLELRSLSGPTESFSVVEGGVGDAATARILGWVRERDTERPISAAEVRVMDAGPSTLTDDNGMFVLDGLPPGETALGITHISFAPEGYLFRTEPGRNYEVRVAMAPDAIPLEGVEVSVRSRTWFRQMDGMRLRMRQGIRGDFLTSDQLEQRGFPPVQEAIRALPSVRVIRSGPHAYDLRFRNCEIQPVVFIDGIQVNEPENGEPLRELQYLSGLDVEAIEVYRGPGSVPAEFSGPDAMCGALIIWTKR